MSLFGNERTRVFGFGGEAHFFNRGAIVRHDVQVEHVVLAAYGWEDTNRWKPGRPMDFVHTWNPPGNETMRSGWLAKRRRMRARRNGHHRQNAH